MKIKEKKMWKLKYFNAFTVLFLLVLSTVLISKGEAYELKIPLGLDEEALKITEGNPLTKGKVDLGRLLFFDKRLSANNTIACATCHIPALGFTDGQPVSSGIHHLQGGRSAPTAINRAFSTAQFWDGRAATLEDQSIGPFANPIEHGFANHDQLVNKISKIKQKPWCFLCEKYGDQIIYWKVYMLCR